MTLKMKNIMVSDPSLKLDDWCRKTQLDMQRMFSKKPNLHIRLDELSIDDIETSIRSFTKKSDIMSQYLMEHKDRLTNLTNDVALLIKGSRIEGIPIHTELIDRDINNRDPEYLNKNQNFYHAAAAGVSGYMLYTGNLDENGNLDVTDLYVKSTMYSPRTQVHEYAHLIDFAYGQSSIDDPDGSKPYRSNNDPTFKPIIEQYKEGLIKFYNHNTNKSINEIQDHVNHHPKNQYYMMPTEIHSRLFEAFYATEIEPYRNITDYNKADIYHHNNEKYGGFSTPGEYVAYDIYRNSKTPFVSEYFKSNYSDILPKNHPEYEKYTGKHLTDEQYAQAKIEQDIMMRTYAHYLRFSVPEPHSTESFSNEDSVDNINQNQNNTHQQSISDQELLERLEEAEVKHLTSTPSTPSTDIEIEF